jgi:Zn-dependent peptidase ImmA (M78 family)/transcriptional regulator with XRE-family HTH domain
MSRSSTKGTFVRERLTEGREARVLTQKDVGRGIKRAESTVSNWERGAQAPEPMMLDSLANTVGVYPSYFLKPMPDYGSAPVFFRSLANATVRARTREKARVRWLQHISLVIQSSLELPPLDVPQPVKGEEYLKLKTGDLEHIASELRVHWDLGNGPIRTMVLVAENAGIVVGVDEVGSTAIDGQGTWSSVDGRPYIMLCTDKYTAYRRQMDIAHEMAHLILHRGVTSEEELDTNFEIIERQAKYLANAFLLPPRSFAAEISSLSLDGFLSLKRRWMVSIGAMIMRAEQLEILSSEAASLLWRYRATRGWNRKEPYDLPEETPVEQPCLLQRCIEMLVNEGGHAKRDLLEQEFSISALDVEMLTCLPPGFFTRDAAPVLRITPKLREKTELPELTEVIPFRRPG